jgi:hypothetical protein
MNTKNKLNIKQLLSLHKDFIELVKTKPDTYAEKKYSIKCISSKYICLNHNIPNLLKKYPGVIESILLRHLNDTHATELDVNITLSTLKYAWDERENNLKLFRDAYVFYELEPVLKTPYDNQEHRLLYYNVNTHKHYQTYVGEPYIKLKSYSFVPLMHEPEGILINYSKNKPE